MKKILGWIKSAWQAVNGHKRDIAGLYCANVMAILSTWQIAESHWVHKVAACIGYLFTAVGWAHAGTKGDISRNGPSLLPSPSGRGGTDGKNETAGGDV